MKLFKFNGHTILGAKKITSFTVDVRSTCDKPCCWDDLASVQRANYIHFKLWKVTYASWIGMKHSLSLKIDGALACCLLNTTVIVSNRGILQKQII